MNENPFVAWLVEMRGPNGPLYLALAPDVIGVEPAWTPYANEAVKFADKPSATLFGRQVADDLFVNEHQWIDSTVVGNSRDAADDLFARLISIRFAEPERLPDLARFAVKIRQNDQVPDKETCKEIFAAERETLKRFPTARLEVVILR